NRRVSCLATLIEQVLNQQRHGTACGALVLATAPGGASDVQVSPAVRFGKAGQEASGGYRTGWWATNIGHVSKVRAQLLLVGVVHGHAPGSVTCLLASLHQLVGQVVVGREQASVDVAQSDHASAGQGGHINDGSGFEAFDVGQSIAQN